MVNRACTAAAHSWRLAASVLEGRRPPLGSLGELVHHPHGFRGQSTTSSMTRFMKIATFEDSSRHAYTSNSTSQIETLNFGSPVSNELELVVDEIVLQCNTPETQTQVKRTEDCRGEAATVNRRAATTVSELNH